jgi:integrase
MAIASLTRQDLVRRGQRLEYFNRTRHAARRISKCSSKHLFRRWQRFPVADVAITRDGIVITIRRSKTDQEGEGRKIGIPYGSNPATCPVRSMQDWLEHCGFTEGPLFRPVDRFGRVAAFRLSAAAVAEVVKRYVAAVGLKASDFAGHSLRSGLATSAAMAGASERSIMNQTGHRSVNTVRRYIRDGSLFRENAAATVGL